MAEKPFVVITGANRGIGHALLERLADQGPVVGTYRSDRPQEPAGASWHQADVTDKASLSHLAEDLAGRQIGLLICNAGVYLDRGHPLDSGYPPDLWAESFAANVTGAFLTVQALLPHLRATKGAKIAIISSQMASQTLAPGGSYAYRASKAAVLNLGRNLAADLKADGIAVGIYHPGWVQTDMGGKVADISVDEAATGLIARFNALTLDTTGCFETWDGRPHPY